MKRSKKAATILAERLLLLLIIFSFAYLSLKIYSQLDQALFVRSRHKSELDELSKQYQAIRSERLKYEEAIKKLKKDEFIELVARKQFKMVKPGEKAYIVLFEGESSATAVQQSLLDLLTEK